MSVEQTVAVVALAWLCGAMLLMGQSIRRGRDLAAELAKRFPGEYEAMGRPRPGYLHSTRRNRFARFVAQREYEALPDPALAMEFDAYRQQEARLVVSLLVSMGVVFVLVMAVRYGG